MAQPSKPAALLGSLSKPAALLGSISKPAALFVSVAFAALITVGVIVGVDRYTRDPTPFEKQVRMALADLGEPAAGSVRVVVVGDSRGRNAFGRGPEAEAALARVDVAAEVVNLSAPGVDFPVLAPAFDEIFATDPDVIVVQVGILRDTPLLVRPNLRRRIIIWLKQEEAPDAFEFKCGNAQNEATLSRSISTVIDGFTTPQLARAEAEELIDEAAARDVAIILVDLPTSEPLARATGDLRDRFHSLVDAELADHPNVFTSGDVELPELDNYCDFTHLNAIGQQRFLAEWGAQFADMLEGIG